MTKTIWPDHQSSHVMCRSGNRPFAISWHKKGLSYYKLHRVACQASWVNEHAIMELGMQTKGFNIGQARKARNTPSHDGDQHWRYQHFRLCIGISSPSRYERWCFVPLKPSTITLLSVLAIFQLSTWLFRARFDRRFPPLDKCHAFLTARSFSLLFRSQQISVI